MLYFSKIEYNITKQMKYMTCIQGREYANPRSYDARPCFILFLCFLLLILRLSIPSADETHDYDYYDFLGEYQKTGRFVSIYVRICKNSKWLVGIIILFSDYSRLAV